MVNRSMGFAIYHLPFINHHLLFLRKETSRNKMSTIIEPPVEHAEKNLEEVEAVTIRFAGDSGDGMQLTGTQFTNTSAVVGNDISTLPDFPAEIRAPAGSLPGVSG